MEEKKYKEMTASVGLSPNIILGELIRRFQERKNPANAGSWLKIKPNELKEKQQ